MLRQIPNAITLFRGLVLTPGIVAIFVWNYAGSFGLVPPPSDYFTFRSTALILATLCVASDFLDGRLARKYEKHGWKSDFGARIDPLMDKAFSYACLLGVLLYYGLGWYLLWLVLFAWRIHQYSVATTQMRARREILEANWEAKQKTGYLFAAQLAFFTAIAAEDVLDGSALWHFVMFAFFVAFVTMTFAVLFASQALTQYRREAGKASVGKASRQRGRVLQAVQ